MGRVKIEMEEMTETDGGNRTSQEDLITITTRSDRDLSLNSNVSVPQKCSRLINYESSLRFLIPSKVAGSIIGKGGRNISRLRNTYNASITIPDCPGPERILTVSSDYATILRVVEQIIPNLEEFFRNSLRNKGGELDVKILVHQSQAGCVIGKGGIKIKDLRKKTGSRIKIFDSCCPMSTDRIIALSGTKLVCLNAIKEIVDLVKETPTKGQVELYDPRNYDELSTDEYGGYSSSGNLNRGTKYKKGVSTFSQGRYPFGREDAISDHLVIQEDQGYGVESSSESSTCSEHIQTDDRLDYITSPEILSDLQRACRDLQTLQQTQRLHANSSVEISVPNYLVGAIIGKGGSNIRKIRSKSGAVINIEDPIVGSDDRKITISGTPSRIQIAQYLLQQWRY